MNIKTKLAFKRYISARANFKAPHKQYGDTIEARGKPLADLIDRRIDFEIAVDADLDDWLEVTA